MKSYIDDVIRDDVNRALEENKYPWIKPIVELVESPQNPFLSPDFFSNSIPKNFLSDPVSAFYLSSGYEMKVTFNESDYLKLFSSQFTDIVFSTDISDRMRTLRKTHRIFLTLKMNSIESPFSFIEPMLCTAFLYNKVSKCIISDLWNFVPERCQSFFKTPQFSFNQSNTASFLIDPSIITKGTGVLILLFSHPTTVDNGINTVIKYYQNPSSISAASATKAVNSSFSKNPNAFSTFCWTFVHLTSENINNLEIPPPFLIDHPISEGEIFDLISEAQSKHLKQVPFSISIEVQNILTPHIFRQLSDIKIMPYLAPIHQLSIHLHQLKTSPLSSARNIMIRISFLSTEDNLPLFVIRSKFNSDKLVEYEYSRVSYHEKSPKFDDYFLIELPYPVKPTSALVFQIYHVHVKMSESKSMTEIGKAVLPLFQSTSINKDNIKDKRKSRQKFEDTDTNEKNDKPDNPEKNEDEKEKKLTKRQIRNQNKNKKSNLVDSDQQTTNDELVFIPDEIHTIPISSDKTSKLIISTYLRSNIISNDKKYNKFTQYVSDCNSGSLDSELIKSISPITITENLMLIFDRVIKMYEKLPFFNFEPLLAITNSVLPYLKPHQLNRYLLLYVFYFAFRDTSKTNNLVQYNLNDKQTNSDSILTENEINNHSQGNEEGKESSSLIDLDQIGFEPKHQAAVNSDTLIDFGNDSLFKNISNTPHRKRRPSVIIQSLYKESDSTPINVKMLRGIIIFLKEKETEAINLLHPLESFINGLLIKSLALSKDRCLTEDFNEYVDLYTKHAANSEFINEIATTYGKLVDLLFDIGLATDASIANSAFIRNCPMKQIVTYVSTAYRPEYFLYSVRFIDKFVDQFCTLVNSSFSGENCTVMQPFFATINQLCAIYDDKLKVEVASKLFRCLTTITPSKIPPGAKIKDGVEFINFILNYSNETAMKSIITKQQLPELMSLIHYLLNKATVSPVTQKKVKLKLSSLANSEGVIITTSYINKSLLTAAAHSSFSSSPNISTSNLNNNNIEPQNDQLLSSQNISLIKTCSSFDATKNFPLESGGNSSIKVKTSFDTLKAKRPRNVLLTNSINMKSGKSKDDSYIGFAESPATSSNSISFSFNESSNNIESSIIAADAKGRLDTETSVMTQTALFRFITVFFGVSDLNGGAYLLQFAYHALQLRNLPKHLIRQSYYLLHQVILKFCPGIIEIYNPCMTKVIFTLFKVATVSSHYHKYIASIIAAMFNRDFATYKNNNRSFAICTRALSMIHYSQLSLERFAQFMKLLSESSMSSNASNSTGKKNSSMSLKKTKNLGASPNSTFDGLKEFYKTFDKLRYFSVLLENPKLTPSQKATILVRRFYAFKYSPDAQFIALEDLKKHQIENGNDLEAINITILQAALIYEYLVKLERLPNFFCSKFGGKHKYHLVSPISSVEAILSSKSQTNKSSPNLSCSSSLYLIGSTSLCPAEIMLDIPKIPSFCDSKIFSEAGFVTLLYECLNEAEKIHRTLISNFILDFIWPIYDARYFYGQMSGLFEVYEKIFGRRLNAVRSQIRPKVGQITQQQPSPFAASAPTTPVSEKVPFEGVPTEKKNSNKNSRTSKNRRSARSKKGSDMNDSEFDNYFEKEEMNDDRFDNVTVGSFEDTDNHNTFFRVMFCGKIFESDNGKAFIYRAEPGTTSSQFTSQLNDYYEFLMGKNKIVIINDEDEEEEKESENIQNEEENENSQSQNENDAKTSEASAANSNINNDNNEATNETQNNNNNNNEASSTTAPTSNTNENNNNNSTETNNNNNETNDNNNNNNEADANSNANNSENVSNSNENSENKEKAENEQKEESKESKEKEESSEETNIDDSKFDSSWKMDDNIGYIKVDKVTEINLDERAPTYQHQIFFVDEYNYKGKYKFCDDLFFNSSHNSTNSSNFSNVYSFFNTYNNNNSYSNNCPYVNYDTFDQSSSSKNTLNDNYNYNYTYFNIYNYINFCMKKIIQLKNKNKKKYSPAAALRKSYKKLAKRTMRRNFLAIRSQLPSLIERSEIIKVEASEFSPVMCAYQHLSDFVVKMKKVAGLRQMNEIQALLVSELTKNKVDDFIMILNVFVKDTDDWKKKKNHKNRNVHHHKENQNRNVEEEDNDDDEEEEEEEEEEEDDDESRDEVIDDIFKEAERKIRKNRKDFEKIVPTKMLGLLKLFLNTLESGIKLHGKWVTDNLQYVPLQFQFEYQLGIYKENFGKLFAKNNNCSDGSNEK